MLDDFQDEDTVKNSEFLDEFRQRLNSQPIENIEERKKDISRSQHIFLGTVLGVGLAGVVSWFILSPDYEKAENVEIPVVRRTNTAIKIQPANPGGMEILNQDRAIYEIIEKTDNNNEKIENLLPPTEEPVLPSIAVMDLEERAKDAVNESNSAINKAEKIIAQEDQKNFVSNISEETKQEIKVDVVEIKDNVVKDNNSTVEIKMATPTVDAKTVVKETPKEVKKETKKEPEVVLASGAWQIQLISSPNKAAMEKAWNDLTKKYSQLKNLPHEIESADLGTKGTFYRLKAGSFTTRNEADKLCNSIKSSGGSCLVKKKQ